MRETPNFTSARTARGVRITAKDNASYLRDRVVSMATWAMLQQMDDRSFDGSCCLELGIGCYRLAKQKGGDQ